MSLRAFHIIFISFVTLLFVAVALWILMMYEGSDMAIHSIGYVAAAFAVISPIYGVYFYFKAKKLLN